MSEVPRSEFKAGPRPIFDGAEGSLGAHFSDLAWWMGCDHEIAVRFVGFPRRYQVDHLGEPAAWVPLGSNGASVILEQCLRETCPNLDGGWRE